VNGGSVNLVPVNVNDTVYIKLKDAGFEHIAEKHPLSLYKFKEGHRRGIHVSILFHEFMEYFGEFGGLGGAAHKMICLPILLEPSETLKTYITGVYFEHLD
jgi:hypothetical protein